VLTRLPMKSRGIDTKDMHSEGEDNVLCRIKHWEIYER
jgi:hypothetical protein